MALFLAGTRIVVQGRHLLGDVRNAVIVSNHASHLDAPVLLQALGVDFRAVAKKEVFYLPVFNSVLRFAGFIEVDRADRAQATRAIARAVDALKGGACFLIFPEGTRSGTGQLGPFNAKLRYRFEDRAGSTGLTNDVELTPTGTVGMVASLIGRRIKTSVAQNLQTLKTILEA